MNAYPAGQKEEMDFRLSLLRLMTAPHEGATSIGPAVSQQIEELAVLVPKRKQASL